MGIIGNTILSEVFVTFIMKSLVKNQQSGARGASALQDMESKNNNQQYRRGNGKSSKSRCSSCKQKNSAIDIENQMKIPSPF